MATYSLITSTTLSTSAANISFTSIPATFTDLILVASLKSNQPSSSDGAYALLELNNSGTTDTGSRFNYVNADIGVVGVGATGYSAPNYVLGWGAGSEGGWSLTRFYLYNYTSASNKVIRCDSWQEATTQTNCRRGFTAGFYNSSSVISTVTIRNATGSYISGSTAYLYGISNA